MRFERRSIVENDRGTRSETRDKPVPHHPCTCSEIEETISGTDVAVENVFFFVLDKGS